MPDCTLYGRNTYAIALRNKREKHMLSIGIVRGSSKWYKLLYRR